VKGQVGGAEHFREAGQSTRGVLHIRFEQEVEPPFERDDSVGVMYGDVRVADDETAGELVEAVQAEHDSDLAPQRVPDRQPASKAAAAPDHE
jgi:hypothetical protein